jgi:hypothetical protein
MTPADGPALQVNARELNPAPATASSTQSEAASTTLATGELIFKGPPREFQTSNPRKWIVLGGLLILAAAAAGGGGLIWFQLQRRAAISAATPRKKERAPEGFEMREPTNVPDATDDSEPAGHGPDTVLEA